MLLLVPGRLHSLALLQLQGAALADVFLLLVLLLLLLLLLSGSMTAL
jgi:hypothetical protein